MLTNKECRRVQAQEIGPGGWKCGCCAPTTPKGRTKLRRRLRSRLKRLLWREARDTNG